MDPLLHSASLVSASAVSNLVAAIWQGAVLALAVWLCVRMLPRLSASARSLVWINVFTLLVLLHIVPAFGMHGPAAGAPVAARIDLDPRWSFALAGIWVLLSAWRAAQLTASAVRLRGLVQRATPLDPGASIQALLACGRSGRAAQLCVSDEVARPSVLGFFKPRILLPPGLLERLSEAELRHVVLHEMEHLRRADDWTNLLQKVALVLFPLNPALVWVERRLCAERELACDDRVVLADGAAKAYAVCLTRLAEYSMLRRGLSLALGAWERRPELARRVHRLLRGPRPAMGRLQAGVATGALIAAVLAGAFALARSPRLVGFAQPARPAAVNSASVAMQPGLMPEPTLQSAMLRESAAAPQLIQAKAILPARHQPSHSAPAKSPRKQSPLRSAPPEQNTTGQTWMVLTEWTDVSMPARPVLVKFDPRGSFAAVPIVGGWLIVRI